MQPKNGKMVWNFFSALIYKRGAPSTTWAQGGRRSPPPPPLPPPLPPPPAHPSPSSLSPPLTVHQPTTRQPLPHPHPPSPLIAKLANHLTSYQSRIQFALPPLTTLPQPSILFPTLHYTQGRPSLIVTTLVHYNTSPGVQSSLKLKVSKCDGNAGLCNL